MSRTAGENEMRGKPGANGVVGPANEAEHRVIEDVRFGQDVVVRSFTNLYGCEIGARSRIGSFVEIQRGAVIGSDCKIQGHTFVCDGVTVCDRAFVGHGVVFVNDRHPRSTRADGTLKGDEDWLMERTIVEPDASLGSGAVILCGVRIGAGSIVGAGAVVTKNVAPGTVVVGNPARPIGPAPSAR